MSKRVRPSLRKLEKAEIAAQPGPGFRSAYDARRAALNRVQARLEAALDRISVASSFTEFSGSTVAQLQHARRFIQEGRDEPELGGIPFWVDGETADELIRILAHLLHDAYVAELTDRAAARSRAEAAS